MNKCEQTDYPLRTFIAGKKLEVMFHQSEELSAAKSYSEAKVNFVLRFFFFY